MPTSATPRMSANSPHRARSAVVLGRAARAGGDGLGRRQRAAVELAVGGQRQGIEQHERGRDHVVGQAALGVAAHARGERARDARGGGVVRERRRIRGRVAGGRRAARRAGQGRGRLPAGHEHRVVAARRGRRRADDDVAVALAERMHVVGLDAVAPVEQRGVGAAGLHGRERGKLSAQARIGHVEDAQGRRGSAVELALQRVGVAPRQCRHGAHVKRRDARPVDRHVVAVAGQLVVRASALEAHVDAAHAARPPREPREQRRVGEQLALERDVAGRRRARLPGVGRAAPQCDRGVQQADEAQVTHVAEEDPPARGKQAERPFEHIEQLAGARQVLGDRVDDDRVEGAGGQPPPVGGRQGEQPHAGEVGPPRDVLAQLGDDGRREVGAPVLLAGRRELAEQQSAADADLQHAARSRARGSARASSRATRASRRTGSGRRRSSSPSRRSPRRAAPWGSRGTRRRRPAATRRSARRPSRHAQRARSARRRRSRRGACGPARRSCPRSPPPGPPRGGGRGRRPARPARRGDRGSSPGRRRGRGTPARRRSASARGRRCGRRGCRAGRGGRRRSARRSGRGGRDSRGRGPAPPTYSSPGTPGGTGCSAASSTLTRAPSTGRPTAGASPSRACATSVSTVVSVGP